MHNKVLDLCKTMLERESTGALIVRHIVINPKAVPLHLMREIILLPVQMTPKHGAVSVGKRPLESLVVIHILMPQNYKNPDWSYIAT